MCCGLASLLASQCIFPDKNKAAVAKAGGLKWVMAALQAHAQSAAVAEAVFGAVKNLVNRSTVTDEDAVLISGHNLLATALEHHAENQPIVDAASGIVRCIGYHSCAWTFRQQIECEVFMHVGLLLQLQA